MRYPTRHRPSRPHATCHAHIVQCLVLGSWSARCESCGGAELLRSVCIVPDVVALCQTGEAPNEYKRRLAVSRLGDSSFRDISFHQISRTGLLILHGEKGKARKKNSNHPRHPKARSGISSLRNPVCLVSSPHFYEMDSIFLSTLRCG